VLALVVHCAIISNVATRYALLQSSYTMQIQLTIALNNKNSKKVAMQQLMLFKKLEQYANMLVEQHTDAVNSKVQIVKVHVYDDANNLIV